MVMSLGLVLVFGVYALAQDAPSKGAVAAPAAAEPPAGGTAVATDAKFEKAAKPVLDQIAQAEKVLKLFETEMAKPEEKRNLQQATNFKATAARFYLAAALKAKQAAALLPKKEEKEAFSEQYEKPNREKAIAIWLELADAAMAKKDYKQAMGLYKDVLAVDSKNEAALEGIKKIQAELAAGAATKGGSSAGGNKDTTDVNSWEKDYKTSAKDKALEGKGYSKTDPGGSKVRP
jgi:tetratricopeptide (TPR) repeat protein